MCIEAYPEYHKYMLRLWRKKTTINIKADRYYVTENFVEEFNNSLANTEQELVYEEDITSILREKSFVTVKDLADETKIIYKEKGRDYSYSCDNNESFFWLTRLKVTLEAYTEVLGEEKCHVFDSYCPPASDIPLYFVNIDGKITFEPSFSYLEIEERLEFLTKDAINPLSLFERMDVMKYIENLETLKHIGTISFTPIAYDNDEKIYLLDEMYNNQFTDLSCVAAQIAKVGYYKYNNWEIEVRLMLNKWYSHEDAFTTAKVYKIKDVKSVCKNCVVTSEAVLDFMYQTLREGNGKKKKMLKILEKFYRNGFYKPIDCTQKVPKSLLSRVQLKNQPWHLK